VPLNDDRQEKANRRHALHEAQRNSIRASATPARRRISLAAGQGSPQTPTHADDDMPDVTGTAVTPMKRVLPLLANFEEWIKMATDNVGSEDMSNAHCSADRRRKLTPITRGTLR
jgi:condensin complex subunit 2